MTFYSQDITRFLLPGLQLEASVFHIGQYCGNWKATTHGSQRASFHLILHGDCWLHLLPQQQSIALREGDAVFLLRDFPCYLAPDADPQRLRDLAQSAGKMQPLEQPLADSAGLVCGFFGFKAGLNDLIVNSLPDYLIIRHDDRRLAGASKVFELIRDEAQREGEAAAPLIERLVDILFFYAIRHRLGEDELTQGLFAAIRRPEFAELIRQLLEHPGNGWSLQDMADLTKMSRANFCKKFQETCGYAPGHFLLCLRIRQATQLLRGGQGIAEVAEAVGYRSLAAFSRAFQKVVGMQPGAYRKVLKNGD